MKSSYPRPPVGWAALAVVCLGLLASVSARATTLQLLAEDDLVDRAELIVEASCVGSETRHLGNRLVTVYSLRIEAVHKGVLTAPSAELRVVLPGGIDLAAPRPVAEIWPGVPSLLPGEAVLLFLRSYGPIGGTWTPVGLGQGVFSVIPATGGQTLASRDLTGASLLDAAAGTVTPGGRRGEPLADLVARVEHRVAAGAEAGR